MTDLEETPCNCGAGVNGVCVGAECPTATPLQYENLPDIQPASREEMAKADLALGKVQDESPRRGGLS